MREKEESGREAEGQFFFPKEKSSDIRGIYKKKEEATTIISYLCFLFLFSLYTAGTLLQSFVSTTKLST